MISLLALQDGVIGQDSASSAGNELKKELEASLTISLGEQANELGSFSNYRKRSNGFRVSEMSGNLVWPLLGASQS